MKLRYAACSIERLVTEAWRTALGPQSRPFTNDKVGWKGDLAPPPSISRGVCKRLAKTDLAFALGLLPMKEIGLRHWVAHSQDFADP
jgi:hypothetical protein